MGCMCCSLYDGPESDVDHIPAMIKDTNLSGLILAYVLDGKGGGKEVDWSEIEAWHPSDGKLWLYLDYERFDALSWVQNSSGLPRSITDQLVNPNARPRCQLFPNGLLIVLRGISPELDDDPKSTISLRLWVDQHRILTTRMRRVITTINIRYALKQGEGPRDQSDILLLALERVSDLIEQTVERMRDTVDDLEDEVNTGGYESMRRRLLKVRRTAIVLQRYLEPQRSAVNQLRQSRFDWLAQEDFERLAELSDNVSMYIDEVAALRDRATIVSEELANQLSVDLNRRMYILSVMSVIFLPLGFVTGLLGANVGGIPLQNDPEGFALVILFITLLTAAQVMVFRWRRWL